ncbi:TetR/AcrR family transcriptional regulator [Conexibacter woesei]|uniref:Transcriptional regulator, TetR family n=1 Tax=Conexibacter woesei (strain DSM 14684 / CCUG 47730 / CIP 108061 / JCM 11494 / NBRC 100937 / ID131577) TaxID=469383 RepID=D3FDV6_CONWI|nr:TetR/AcrR family transcriptional regulator [Conexibacter woesei]ADB51572.1 transcriptional regulator, TetR family [Conexibacter woesei DSM 14684]
MGSQIEPLPSASHAGAAFAVRSRRVRLIAAMAEVVSEEGYRATSVSKVVAAAGVSRNSFYEHFANKEDCFLAAYDATVEQVMARVREATASATSRQAALEAGFAAFLGFAAAEPELAWLCVVEVLAAGPRALARRDAAMRSFGSVLEGGHGDADGGTDVPPVLTEVLVGGIYEVIYARILNRETATLPSLLPDVLYVWLAPFVGAVRAGAVRVETARTLGIETDPLLKVAPEQGRSDGDKDVF